MPNFSTSSRDKLETCELPLIFLFEEVVKHYDCTIIQGYRSPEEQAKLYKAGRSKVITSLHNRTPALAVDVAPWFPNRNIPWPQTPPAGVMWPDPRISSYIKDMDQFYHFAGFVLGLASEMPVFKHEWNIRWGGDWDRDQDVSDQTFDDLVHFEIHRKNKPMGV